jgi:hypothetical protein
MQQRTLIFWTVASSGMANHARFLLPRCIKPRKLDLGDCTSNCRYRDDEGQALDISPKNGLRFGEVFGAEQVRSSGMWCIRRWTTTISCTAILAFFAALAGAYVVAQEATYSPPKATLLGSAPQPIYSSDPNEVWNRIFYFLFSRRAEMRLSDLFPEGAPFVDGFSTRLFERDEIELFCYSRNPRRKASRSHSRNSRSN